MRIFEEKSKAARHAATPEPDVAPVHPLLRLQRTIGNRATERMLEGFSDRKSVPDTLFHAPAVPGGAVVLRRPKEKPSSSDSEGDFQLPWKHGDYTLFEVNSSDIRCLCAIGEDQEKTVRAAIPAVAKQIAQDNARIEDSASQVKHCIVAATTTRFAFWNGKPVLALNPADVSVDTAAHEMGHAIFQALKKQGESKGKGAGKARGFRLTVADIYARLKDTDDHTVGEETQPAGLWIVDPSQWSPGSAMEHPWQDPDEFFASAKEAYQLNRKGLERSIAKLKKVDARVGPPAKELLALLRAFFGKGTKTSAKLSKERAATAGEELQRETGVSNVEDTVWPNTPLDWLLNPGNRPKKTKARPSLESPY